MKDFYEVVEQRRSCRSFLAEPIEKAVLLRMLNAANMSPSAHNTQPWHFCAVTGDDEKRRLFAGAGEEFFKDLIAGGADKAEAKARADESERFFCGIPSHIIVFAQLGHGQCIEAAAKQDDNTTAAKAMPQRQAQIESILRMQSASVAAGQLLFAAQAEGLGACWYCMPLYCPRVFREFAGLPDSFSPLALIAIGRCAAQTAPRQKRPLSEKMSAF